MLLLLVRNVGLSVGALLALAFPVLAVHAGLEEQRFVTTRAEWKHATSTFGLKEAFQRVEMLGSITVTHAVPFFFVGVDNRLFLLLSLQTLRLRFEFQLLKKFCCSSVMRSPKFLGEFAALLLEHAATPKESSRTLLD